MSNDDDIETGEIAPETTPANEAAFPEPTDAESTDAESTDAESTDAESQVTSHEPPAAEALLVEDLGMIERKPAELAGDTPTEPEPPPDAADLPPAELRAVVEGLLFVSTKPLTTARLAGCLPGTSVAYLEGFLAGLAARFERERRGWELRREAHGWRLMTRATFYPWVRQLERKELPTKLSKGGFETLAVVAYKQPVARGAIEDIRGVQCGPVLRQLMDLKLVAVVGRDDHA